MKTRCFNPNSHEWHLYGGRGITVCARWLDFKNFLADMGPRPPHTELDRIDVNGNYKPGNCRWTDDLTQANNRRAHVRIKGRNQSHWQRETGLSSGAFFSRRRKGLSEDEIISPRKRTPPARRWIELNGETLSLLQWAQRLGISTITLHKRLNAWPKAKALTTPPQRNGHSTKGRKLGRRIP